MVYPYLMFIAPCCFVFTFIFTLMYGSTVNLCASILVATVITILFCGFIFSSADVDSNVKGFNDGYTIHNSTIYNTSVEYTTYIKKNDVDYDSECMKYSYGYIYGYKKWLTDNHLNIDTNVTKYENMLCSDC